MVALPSEVRRGRHGLGTGWSVAAGLREAPTPGAKPTKPTPNAFPGYRFDFHERHEATGGPVVQVTHPEGHKLFVDHRGNVVFPPKGGLPRDHAEFLRAADHARVNFAEQLRKARQKM